MTCPKSRRAAVALQLLLLAGTALPLAAIAAPAAVQAQAQPFAAWNGVWALQALPNGRARHYLELKVVKGQVSGLIWSERDGKMVDTDWIEFDMTKAGEHRLVGVVGGTGDSGEQGVELLLSDSGFLTLTASRSGEQFAAFAERTTEIGGPAALRPAIEVARAMTGKWNTPLGDLTITARNTETSLEGSFTRPGGVSVLHAMRGSARPSGETQDWRRSGTDADTTGFNIVLSPDGQTFYAFGSKSKSIGGVQFWQATRAEATPQPTPAPTPTPTPAPSPAPQPVPAPAPDRTAQAGMFHQLKSFDVRLDEARAERDGRVHVFLTARNRSGSERQVGAGTFVAVMTDADGVGVRESQVWRAGGDAPASFGRSPTVPPGGELKFRFVLAPPVVHAPLQRVSIRESDNKALFFSVAQADPGASSAPAPAAGSGAFKALSKFDVRIDRIAAARDGKLEAFLTLRNPGTAVEATSKGWIKLSAADPDGAKATSVSALYSVRGERGAYNELPALVYAEPGREIRLRYVFDQAISGPITISDGTVSQTFTAGGSAARRAE
ncbi:hypothetical protein [Altericroceibacterium xinjiangense]|uniref:hypothetical protein n=1 Tax=Altericroceibacterium xinjiangense TaxID=762261 RepID=UPI0013E0308B|nr:hypothetical protein [Altericroceibacterium xinjiangense]